LEEVQKLVCEDGGGSIEDGQEPTRMEELDIDFGPAERFATVAVPDYDLMDAAQIKDHKVAEGPGVRACVISVVSDLDNLSKCCEGGWLEEFPIPLLDQWVNLCSAMN
jgi:hypothetical protein